MRNGSPRTTPDSRRNTAAATPQPLSTNTTETTSGNGKTIPTRRIRPDIQVLLRLHGATHAQPAGHQHLGGIRLHQVSAGHPDEGGASLHGVAFDPKGGTFRNELYPQYKANRNETPEDIVTAVPYIKRILEAMRIPCLEVPGYEADDVIGTLARKAAGEGFEVYMVTPDKDFGQLIDRHVYIYKQRRNGEGVEIVGCEQLREQYGIDDPRLVIDILALWGDAADNIPGVPGIGEKSAVKLVNEFGTVENILAHTDALKGKQKENILAGREQLLLSKRLATIETDVPIAFVPEELVMEDPDCDALRDVYKELDFGMFLREMEGTRTTPFTKAVKGTAPCSAPTKEDGTDSAPQGTDLPVQRDLFGNPVATAGSPSQSAQETALLENLSAGYHTVSDTPHEYHTVTTPQQLADLVARLETEKEFCFDVETSGFDCHTSRIVGISFSASEGEACYVPISEGDPPGRFPRHAQAASRRTFNSQNRAEHQVRHHGARRGGHPGSRLQVRHHDTPLPARPGVSPRHEPPGPFLPQLFAH